MKTIKIYGLLLLFFILLGALVFRCAWGNDMVFSGSDANIGLAQRGRMLSPEKFLGAHVSAPLLGEAVKASPSFSNLGQCLLSPQLFADAWYAFFLIVSSVALMAYLRLWNIGWMACLFGALSAFWVGSVTLSSGGHIYKLGTMAFFSVSLYLVERSVRSSSWRSRIAYAFWAGLGVGLMLLEQQDVGLFAGLFLGSYALFRLVGTGGGEGLRWLAVLLPIVLVALPLVAPTAMKAYSRNVTEVGFTEDSEDRWNFVTQWSMVPSELPELIAPGYTGWYTGHPDFPYWGICGQSPEWKEAGRGFRNFRLDSLYIGVLPIFIAALGFAIALRRIRAGDGASPVFIFWGAAAIIALLLSFGKFCPLYKLFYHLPLVGNIRAPVKFLHNFQVIIGILSAFGLHQILVNRREEDQRVFVWGWRITAMLAVLMGLTALTLRIPSMEDRFKEWGEHAPAICAGISHAWLHAAGMAALVVLAILLVRRSSPSKAAVAGMSSLLLAAVVFDSFYLTKQYFRADNYAALRAGNPVINYLKDNQGAERTYCFTQQGVYNMWISVDFLYHDIHAFNFGQMPRMPNDYKAFFSSVGNDWHRFMQLTSSRYGLAPAGIYAQISQSEGKLHSFVKPVSGFRFVNGDGRVSTEWIQQITHPNEQVLFECTDVPPRFSLFPAWETVSDAEALNRLGSSEFVPDRMLLLSDSTPVTESPMNGAQAFEPVALEKINYTQARIRTDSTTGGILRFNQRYNDQWSVWVDGVRQPLLKCNYINMGVHVPEGRHEVVFRCPKQPKSLFLQVSTMGIGLFLPVGLLIGEGRKVKE